MNQIEIKGVDNFLFKNLNLEIPQGEFVVVIGDNGAGKSTLINLIAGKLLPTNGRIIIGNIDVTKQPEHKRAKNIAYVFQDPKIGTNPNMTVRENLALAKNKGSFNLLPSIRRRDNEKLQTLTKFPLAQSVGTLSGGERQRLSLVMATINKPQVLLLDEHTSALDPSASRAVMALTEKIVRENNLTAIMITHSIHDAVHYGDRLLFMRNGQIIHDVRERTIESVANMFEDTI